MEVLMNIRDPLFQILIEEILQLARELNSRRTSSNDNHVQQALDFLLRLSLEHGRLDTVHDTLADVLRIANFLQEARILSDSRDAYTPLNRDVSFGGGILFFCSFRPRELCAGVSGIYLGKLTEGGILGTYTDNQHIEGHLSRLGEL